MTGFTNAGREALSPEFQRGDHGAGYADFGAVAGNAVALAQHPDAACAIGYLIDPVAHQPIGMIDRARDRNLLVHEGAGVTVKLAYVGLLRTPGEQQHYP